MATLVRVNRYMKNNAEDIVSHLAVLSFMVSTLVLFTVLSM